DGVSGVVPVSANRAEDRNDARLADDGSQVVLHAGADSGIAVEIEFAAAIELDFASHVGHVAGVDAVPDLPGEVGRAVVAAADVHGPAIAWRAGPLRIEVDFLDPVVTGGDNLSLSVVGVIVGPAASHEVVPSIQ